MLPIGDVILERDGYGTTNLGKLTERPRVRTLFLTGSGNKSAWEELASDDTHKDEPASDDTHKDEPVTLTCLLCGYTWNPKTATPKRCPNCNAILTLEEEWVEVEE
jgi:predicted Zn-ribbon and HTH transcriptional regulator